MLIPPKRSLHLGALALLGAFLPALAQAQDLATLARKEKARRAKVNKPVKVLTEEDGKEAATKGSGSVTALQGDSTTSSAAAAQTERQPGDLSAEAQEASWRARAQGARAQVTEAEKTLARMERDLAAFRSDIAPVTAKDAQDPFREQNRETRMFEMTKRIEAQKTAIADAKKAVAALEEEARGKGIPAGWLR